VQSISLVDAFKGLTATERFARYRELWHQAGQYQIITDFPLHLDIELSAVCNLKCRYCFQNGLLAGPLGLMSMELYRKIIDEGAAHGLCAIKLQVRGESLLHPRFFDCVAYAKERGIMDVQVTTNGLLLTDDAIQQLFDSHLDGLIISYDRHHSDAVNSDYHFVEQAIRNVLDRRATLCSKLWVRIQASSDADDQTALRCCLQRMFPEADQIDANKIHLFDYDRESYPNLHRDYELLPCSYPMQRLAIYWNGDVTACCMDYNNQFRFGNTTVQPVREIWSSSVVEAFRSTHATGRRSEQAVCNNCLVAIHPKVLEEANRS
jgi:radical SAM protein with 4Fe4S-binding SPASM domain